MHKDAMFHRVVKINLAIVAFLIIITIFFNYFSYGIIHGKLMDNYREMKLDEVRQLSDRIERVIQRSMQMLEQIAALNSNGEAMKNLDHDLKLYLEVDFVKEVLYADKNGAVAYVYSYSEGIEEITGANVSEEQYFVEAKKRGSRYISRNYAGNESEVLLSAPIFRNNTGCLNCIFDGVIMARLNLDNILNVVLGPINNGKSPDYVVLFDSDGTVLYHIDLWQTGINFSNSFDKEKYPELWKLYNETLYNEEGDGEYVFAHKKGKYSAIQDLRKSAVYTSFEIGDMRWILWSITPIQEMSEISGIENLKLLLYFNVFIVFIVSLVIFGGLLLACRADLPHK